MGHGSTDKNTLKLQQLLRSYEKSNNDTYEQLEELLSINGYIVYRNSKDILMLRRNKDNEGLSTGMINALVNGVHPSHYMEGDDDE